MKKILLGTLFSLSFSSYLSAQIVFKKSYSVNINNELGYISHLALLPDSGYIFSTTAFDKSNNFILIGRLNKYGNTIWLKQIDEPFTLREANFVISTTGFLLLSYSTINTAFSKYFSVLIKMDMIGNPVWSKSYGDSTRSEACEHVFLTPNSIYLAGETYTTADPSDLYLLKLDTAGNYIWGKTYDADGIDYLRDAKQLKNGDLLLSGLTRDSINHFFNSLFRIDTSGSIVWNNRFHLPSFKEFNSQALNEDYDGSLLISGHADTAEVSSSTYFGKWDISLLKLTSSGSFI